MDGCNTSGAKTAGIVTPAPYRIIYIKISGFFIPLLVFVSDAKILFPGARVYVTYIIAERQ